MYIVLYLPIHIGDGYLAGFTDFMCVGVETYGLFEYE